CRARDRWHQDVGRSGAMIGGRVPRVAQRRVILFCCPILTSSARVFTPGSAPAPPEQRIGDALRSAGGTGPIRRPLYEPLARARFSLPGGMPAGLTGVARPADVAFGAKPAASRSGRECSVLSEVCGY